MSVKHTRILEIIMMCVVIHVYVCQKVEVNTCICLSESRGYMVEEKVRVGH